MRDRKEIVEAFDKAINDHDDKSEIAAHCFLEVLLDIRENQDNILGRLERLYYRIPEKS